MIREHQNQVSKHILLPLSASVLRVPVTEPAKKGVPVDHTRKFITYILMLSFLCLPVTIPAYGEEIVLSIGDSPVEEELLLDSQDESVIISMLDGSMLPEYTITDIEETSENVIISSEFTEAISSGYEQSDDVFGLPGDDQLLEIVDNVDDFNAFRQSPFRETVLQNAGTAISAAASTATQVVEAAGAAQIISQQTASSGVQIITAVSQAAAGLISGPQAAVSAQSAAPGSGTVSVSGNSGNAALPAIATTASRQSLLSYARQFLGCPYVYGGTDLLQGSDCSGFVQQIFKHFGITTGRTSRDQYAKAVPVTLDQLQPGDLIFYASDDYVNHVAIYAGNGIIIHSASAKLGVCTARFDYRQPYGYGRFIFN